MITKFSPLSQLSSKQIEEYRSAVHAAFPPIIEQSPIIRQYWERVETYFPSHQLFAINSENNVLGIINTIPFHWDKTLLELPVEGWDWLVTKGITDYENKRTPNTLGGLQIIVTKTYLGMGFSKKLIAEAKRLKESFFYENLVIPIRPTFKHRHPDMTMEDYLELKREGKIYDPWIRTHLQIGGELISVCSNSMNVTGDLNFWQSLAANKIDQSGPLLIPGVLNPVEISIESDFGEYREENIWVRH